jgi:hypothetical protein
MTTTLKTVFAALLVLALASCGEQEGKVKIGAKNFGESRILAHMMAALAEEQGLPVEGVVDYPSTQAILEALKRGDIDAYPEYNGTGLVMLGQNPISDGDAATGARGSGSPTTTAWRCARSVRPSWTSRACPSWFPGPATSAWASRTTSQNGRSTACSP